MAAKRKKRRAVKSRCSQASRANLALGAKYRWKPGQSGNPGGRPRFKKLNEAARQILASPLPDDPKRTFAEAIVERLADAALRGSVGAAQELADRAEGRPGISVDVNAADPLVALIEAMARTSERLGPPEGMEDDATTETETESAAPDGTQSPEVA